MNNLTLPLYKKLSSNNPLPKYSLSNVNTNLSRFFVTPTQHTAKTAHLIQSAIFRPFNKASRIPVSSYRNVNDTNSIYLNTARSTTRSNSRSELYHQVKPYSLSELKENKQWLGIVFFVAGILLMFYLLHLK